MSNKYWENSSMELDKMTVKQFLDCLTDENWHNERLVIEAIIDGRENIMQKAMLIWLQHETYGCMPMELVDLRHQLYKDMNEE